MTIDVFLSVGRTSTPEQETFISAVEELLSSKGLRPRTVGRTDFTVQKPLRPILDLMESCSGAIIIAFERFHFERGVEFPGGPNWTPQADIRLPTVWNQIEATMAYTLGKPLLAVADSRLRDEGLLEDGYDWFVKWLDLTPASLADPAFLAIFDEWGKKVESCYAEQKSGK